LHNYYNPSQTFADVLLGGPLALMKAQATQTFEFCAREAAQIFGGLQFLELFLVIFFQDLLTLVVAKEKR
jgi:hypothetical protein